MITDIQKKRIVGGVLAFLAVISLYFIVKLINEIRTGQYIGTKDTPSTITVTGDGEVYATADIATLTFTARGQGATVKIAQEKETTIINKAVEYLKEKGIAEKDIKTSNYNLQPQYDYGNCSSGYCPTRTPKISLRLITKTHSKMMHAKWRLKRLKQKPRNSLMTSVSTSFALLASRNLLAVTIR